MKTLISFCLLFMAAKAHAQPPALAICDNEELGYHYVIYNLGSGKASDSLLFKGRRIFSSEGYFEYPSDTMVLSYESDTMSSWVQACGPYCDSYDGQINFVDNDGETKRFRTVDLKCKPL